MDQCQGSVSDGLAHSRASVHSNNKRKLRGMDEEGRRNAIGDASKGSACGRDARKETNRETVLTKSLHNYIHLTKYCY